MKVCKLCGEEKSLASFPKKKSSSGKLYIRPYCNSCKYNKAKQGYLSTDNHKEKTKGYHKAYHLKNPEASRYKANVHFDKMKGFITDISLDEYRALVNNPCSYCSSTNGIGLDRKDSSKGHTKENVVPCCEKCNYLLSDIPYEAKLLLIPSLIVIYLQGLLHDWTIPTKRSNSLGQHRVSHL